MNRYMFYWTKERRLHKYIENIEFIEKSMLVLNQDKISKESLANVVNLLADFLLYNRSYENIIEFNELVDYVVNLIEEFNTTNGVVSKNSIEMLRIRLENFHKFLVEHNKVKILFYGADKYNLLGQAFKLPIQSICNVEEYINSRQQYNGSSIEVLVLSEETTPTQLDYRLYFDDVIYYDKLMNYLFEIGEKIYYGNYDYYYLSNELAKSKEKDIDTIVVGNSYPLTGIKVELLKSKAINLSLSSQDLYYSFQLAKKAINNNTKIKRCIIGSGYYLVNHDLSRSQSEDAINRVKNVYYPILNDKHNSEKVDVVPIETLDDILKDSIIRFIFDLDYLDQYFKSLIHRSNKSYFNSIFTREMNSMLGGVKLRNISDEEKWKLGQFRANQHNKLTKYTKTTEEYNKVFNEFINFLSENGVTPIVVIFPSTQYYSKFLNEQYSKEFYSIIDFSENNCKIKIIDFSKKDIFVEDDFIDFDHMGDSGAKKITVELNRVIYK